MPSESGFDRHYALRICEVGSHRVARSPLTSSEPPRAAVLGGCSTRMGLANLICWSRPRPFSRRGTAKGGLRRTYTPPLARLPPANIAKFPASRVLIGYDAPLIRRCPKTWTIPRTAKPRSPVRMRPAGWGWTPTWLPRCLGSSGGRSRPSTTGPADPCRRRSTPTYSK